MTRIGLLSDTHIPVDARVLPAQIMEIFRGVDLILHAGDIYLPSVLDELENIAPVLAARGDDDFDVDDDGRVKDKHTLAIEGISISLSHTEPGLGPWSVFPDSRQEPGIASYQYEQVAGVLIFGHSHMPKLESRGGFLLINPGSPTFPYYVHRAGTVGLLTLTSNGAAEVSIVQLQ